MSLMPSSTDGQFDVRPATKAEISWIRSTPDPVAMAEISAREIEAALAATSIARHWKPVEMDEEKLR